LLWASPEACTVARRSALLPSPIGENTQSFEPSYRAVQLRNRREIKIRFGSALEPFFYHAIVTANRSSAADWKL